MVIETIKESIKTSKYVGHENMLEMVEGDIIVPDIKPDILSLIKVDGNVYVTRKTIQEDRVIIEGVIDVYAIYMSDDENNSIRGLNALLNFNETVQMDKCKTGMLPVIKCNLGPIEYRTLNGRKLNVKCPINIDIRVMENAEFEMIKELPDCNDIQMLKKEVKFNTTVGSECQTISIKENISLPEGYMPIGEILKTDICIMSKDYKISYNKILAKAEAKIRLIYVVDDPSCNIQTFETMVPVMGFIDMPGANENMKINIDYNMLSCYVKPVYQDLKANGFYVEAEVELLVRASEERTIVIIQDLYNPNANLRYDMLDIDLNQNVTNKTEIINISEFIAAAELDNSKILDVRVTPSITEKKVLDDRVMIEGNNVIDILFYKLDKNMMETKRVEVPFQQVVNIKGMSNNMKNNIDIRPYDVRYELQGAGQLEVRASLELNIEIEERVNFNIINSVEQTEEVIEPVASIVIYYVKSGDSLWKIAKNYRTTIELIKEVNSLSEDTIYPGQQLMIPRRVVKSSMSQLM